MFISLGVCFFSLCLLCTTENCERCRLGEDPKLYSVAGVAEFGKVSACDDHVGFIDRLLEELCPESAMGVLQNLAEPW